MPITQSETVTVKFDGQSHQVDIDTFTQVLLNYSTVVQAAASEVGVDGDTRVAIQAIESGSLDVLVSITTTGLSGLLEMLVDNKEAIVGVLAVTAGVYELKQKLAGKGKVIDSKPNGDGSHSIVTEKGDVRVSTTVFNTYINHPEATTAIDRSFSKLEEHPEITAFQLSKDNDVMFRAEHDEFTGIATSCNYENEMVRHEQVEATLNIMKPFLGASKTRKWEFYYQGGKISASIDDDSFIEEMYLYSFKVGSTMHVMLDIEKEYLEKYRVWANRSYRILNVYSVDDPPEEPIQETMF